jgi:hypothetical protein
LWKKIKTTKMKKVLFTAITAMTIGSTLAQSSFITKTCYRGAFAPAPTPMWTDQWTEWDPQNKSYPAPNMTVTGNITSNTTWSTGAVVLLSAQCFVKNNSILTIQPGVIVLGDKAVTGAGLFITTGSQLMANGTATQPIVFTSNQVPGQRGLGDWGGIILMGLATNNSPAGTGTLTNPAGTNYIEGLPVSADTQYGGSNDNDNSGSLQYVRIEFPGYVYQPNKEINGLTFGAVGRGTTIDHVQVSFSNDDSYEWFGGAVNCKHLVAFRGLDDDWDTDNGFHGNVQFCLGVRDPLISDNPSVSTSEGFESDNDPNGTTATPLTSAIFSNITDIGPLRGNPTATFVANTGFQRAARIRRNSNLKIYNSILMDHRTRGLYIDGALCEGNANTGALKFQNNILAGYGVRATEVGTFAILTNPNAWIVSQGNDTLKTTTGLLIAPYSYTAGDYRPDVNSVALSGASFTDAALAAVTATSSANALATIPGTACLGLGTQTAPIVFIPSTTVTPEYCSLVWMVPSGVAVSNSTAMNPTFTISTLGTFSITLMVSNANGTTSVVNAITTNTCLDVSVKNNGAEIADVQLLPNPTNGDVKLNIITPVATEILVNVYDLTGKSVMPMKEQDLANGKNSVDLKTDELQNGIYFVTVSSSKGKKTVKLVVNR